MLKRIFAFTLLISTTAYAADNCDSAVFAPGTISSLVSVSERVDTSCPKQINVRDFCAAVSSQSGELAPSHSSVRFLYQSLIYSAACVEASDSQATIRSKIQTFWDSYSDTILCNSFNFLPRNGNILKLAISSQSDSFIDDSLRKWRIDLNQVDRVDRQTVLDYIDSMKRDAGTNADIIRMYQRYYDRFRAAGAKHSNEI